MNLRDRRRWKTARTFADLCELMALWTEGQIKTWPGHDGEPDPETADLLPTLAATNRGGYLTTGSQPGVIGPGYDGLLWEQRAAVEGLVADQHLLDRLRRAAEAARLTVIVHEPADRSRGLGGDVVVTRVDGSPYTGFGAKLNRRVMKGQWPVISRDALQQVLGAWQVTVIDLEWGRDTVLWQALDRAIR